MPDETGTEGPKKHLTLSVNNSDDNMDDEDIPKIGDVEEADVFLFGDRITRNMLQTSCHQVHGDQDSSDHEANED